MVLSDGVKLILDRLFENGIEAFVVGGAVRDSMLGRIPSDYDLASDAEPEKIKSLFDKVILTGERYKTITVIENGEKVEITQYRSEADYGDNRHPGVVLPAASIEEDLVRRDFTVNAMAYNEQRGLIDPCGGRRDLRHRLIRAVGNPDERFSEDALRIIRAYRFASVLGFDIEEQTAVSARKLCRLLSDVSVERIQHELSLLLTGLRPSATYELIENGGLEEFFGTDCHEKAGLIDRSSCDSEVRFVMLCMTCGMKKFGDTAKKLRYPNRFCKAVEDIERLLERELEDKRNIKSAMGNFAPEIIKKALTVKNEFLQKDTARSTELINQIQRNNEPYKISQLDISGDDLLKLGFKGQDIGKVLSALLEFVIDYPQDNNKSRLIEEAKRLYKQNNLG